MTESPQPTLSSVALRIALGEIGEGETGENNATKYQERIGAWCAAFVSWCYSRAAEELNRSLPFKPSSGAKQLYRRIAQAGEKTSRPTVGGVICWHRGRAGSWSGHIGFVQHVQLNGLLETVEGNIGRFPSVVKRFLHDPSYERIVGYARLL